MRSSVVIGVDFDNTIITYDEVMHRAAVDRGLISPVVPKVKKNIRDQIRLRSSCGEVDWQKVQALVYGPAISEATLMVGAVSFLQECRSRNIETYIISHKTEYAGYDETGTNLRTAALSWMEKNQFFALTGLGFQRSDVHFANTRAEKVARIAELGCTHFIDDLEETFLEPSFPAGVAKLLFNPAGDPVHVADVKAFPTWEDIGGYFFRAR